MRTLNRKKYAQFFNIVAGEAQYFYREKRDKNWERVCAQLTWFGDLLAS